MVRLLSSWANRAAILVIRGYQKTLSGKINRDCIYGESCSHYAIREFQKDQNTFQALRASLNRYRGCGISDISVKGNVVKLRNLHGAELNWETLDERTRTNLTQQLGLKTMEFEVHDSEVDTSLELD